ncbi:MAG: efflux RND transporter periplasmic adaptor subunit [Pseudomonadota bacterium]
MISRFDLFRGVAASGYPSMPTKRPFRSVALFALGMLLASYAAAQTNVDVVAAVPSAVAERFELSGTLTASQRAGLSPLVDGLVESLAVDIGSEVQRGDLLLRLDTTLASAALRRSRAERAQAEAVRAEAQRLVEEARRLVGERHLPKTELDTRTAALVQADAALAVTDASLAEQREIVARHQLKAPFAGVVTARTTDVGEWVARGSGVLELTSLGNVRLDVQAPQERFADLSKATVVEIIPDASPGVSIAARVAARLPVGGGSGARTFLVRVEPIDDSVQLLPGTSAVARFQIGSANDDAVQIPRDALIRHPDGGYSVFVVNDTGDGLEAERRQVDLGRSAGELVQVVRGVQAQDRVVVRGNEVLQDGERIRVNTRPLR